MSAFDLKFLTEFAAGFVGNFKSAALSDRRNAPTVPEMGLFGSDKIREFGANYSIASTAISAANLVDYVALFSS